MNEKKLIQAIKEHLEYIKMEPERCPKCDHELKPGQVLFSRTLPLTTAICDVLGLKIERQVAHLIHAFRATGDPAVDAKALAEHLKSALFK